MFQSASTVARIFPSPSKGFSLVRWSPPLEAWFKVNVDASFLPDEGVTGIDIIVRYSYGRVLFSAIKFLGFTASADYAEGMAAIEGFTVAQDLGFRPMVVESDSLRIVGLFSAPVEDLSEVGVLISNFRQQNPHPSGSCQYVSRNGNEAAHRLATLASHRRSDCIWMED